MSRSSRDKEKYGNGSEVSGARAYEGTAARTRPFSLEEILLRRKNKKLAADAKDGSGDPRIISRQGDSEKLSDHPIHDGDYKHGKESAHVNVKDREDTIKRSSRKEETTTLMERIFVKGGNKESRDSETNMKVRLENEIDKNKERKNEKHIHRSRKEDHPRDEDDTGAVKERKYESKTHHRSRNEEHLSVDKEMSKEKEHRNENRTHHRSRNEERRRDDKETVRAKESKNEKDSHHRSRNEERRRDDTEMARAKESKNEKESHHQSRSEKRLRDEIETRKTYTKRKEMRSERESRKEERRREEGKHRLETDESAVNKHDSAKYDPEPAEMNERKKDSSKSHNGDSDRKWRRSGSGELRARDRSISLSPRAHKRTYDGRDQGESSIHSPKDRRQHHSIDRDIASSNGGHASNHNWRHGGRGNRLGGYSPRKRRSETSIKTPSPTLRSPEKKNAGWDFPPTGTDGMPAGSFPDIQSLHHSVSTEHIKSSVLVTPSALGPLSGASPKSVSKAMDVDADPVQLIESTRPLRRLYVENLPASATDKSVVECLNSFLLSSGVSHIQGTQPCMSCSINKERGQALLEFLTAEDATTALSFDGRSFCGSVLKIRRPKDFVEPATGGLEKSGPSVDTISDIIKDSPHKIFIGGISKALSSSMLMEIVGAFGHLKAYRFEVNDDLHQPCAFLEYIDQTITLKACAGLNGMNLGGQVLTVVQAVPDASVEGNAGKPPSYGIPNHAKPLLSKPTKVLKLTNVFNLENLSSLSGYEIEETLEDIRIECSRFGIVKSINIVRSEISSAITDQTNERTVHDPDGDSFTKETETLEQDVNLISVENTIADASIDVKGGGDLKNDRPSVNNLEEDFGKNEMHVMRQPDSGLATHASTCKDNTDPKLHKFEEKVPSDVDDTKVNNALLVEEEIKQEEATDVLQEPSSELNYIVKGESQTSERTDSKEVNHMFGEESSKEVNHIFGEESQTSERAECKDVNHIFGGESQTSGRTESKEVNHIFVEESQTNETVESRQETSNEDIFEHGCVLVEFLRTEASCIAAHCLHGRLYGDNIVSVNYIPHDLYLSRFRK